MTAGTRSLRSVLSELLLVTVARSCGGGSSITDSSYRSRSSFFFLRLSWSVDSVFLVLTRDIHLHVLLGARLGFFPLIPLFSSVPHRYWC